MYLFMRERFTAEFKPNERVRTPTVCGDCTGCAGADGAALLRGEDPTQGTVGGRISPKIGHITGRTEAAEGIVCPGKVFRRLDEKV